MEEQLRFDLQRLKQGEAIFVTAARFEEMTGEELNEFATQGSGGVARTVANSAAHKKPKNSIAVLTRLHPRTLAWTFAQRICGALAEHGCVGLLWTRTLEARWKGAAFA